MDQRDVSRRRKKAQAAPLAVHMLHDGKHVPFAHSKSALAAWITSYEGCRCGHVMNIRS